MRFRNNTLATKLILYIFIFSSFLTLITTSLQLFLDYKSEVSETKSQFTLIQNGFINGLSSAIWFYDEKQISNHLDGILKISDVSVLNLDIKDGRNIVKHSELAPDGPKKNFELTYFHEGKERNLGTLSITLTLDKVIKKIEKKIIIVLLSNAIKTFLVSSFIFIIFYKFVSTPLEEIALNAREVSEAQNNSLPEKNRANIQNKKLNFKNNELEEVKDAISQMTFNFNYSYQIIKENESRLTDIAALTADVIFETDQNFNINFLNLNDHLANAFLERLVLGTNLFTLNFDHQSKIILEEKKTMLQNGIEIKSFVFQVPHGDQTLYYSLSLKPFVNDYSKIIGFRGVFVDVTKRLESEKKVEEQKLQISQFQKLDAIGELTSGIAHDFNNVLSVIAASIKNISRLEIENDSLNKYILKAQNATDRGIKLSRRLLVFSRKQTPDEKVLNINESIESIIDMVKVALSASTVINKDFADDLWDVKIDINMLENILINLSVNARDAMLNTDVPEVLLKTRNVVHKNREMVLIEIKDNGEGIPDHIKTKIFEPFFTTKNQDKGTGLGLSMAFNFVKQINGDISVESAVGKGASFKIYIPRYVA